MKFNLKPYSNDVSFTAIFVVFFCSIFSYFENGDNFQNSEKPQNVRSFDKLANIMALNEYKSVKI